MAIVTLTSDFGTADGYVGAMKGVILSRAPGARIVDIAHDVRPCDIAAGAYCLAQAAPYFPPGTIHVAVIDPGVGTERRAVVVDDGRCWYLGPDNGLLSLVVPDPVSVHAIARPTFLRREVSATFHGRDVFAAAAGNLASGARPGDAGPAVSLTPYEWPDRDLATLRMDERMVRIVHVDRFGNLITDARADELPDPVRIRAGERIIDGLSRTFGDVGLGVLLAYIGSAGTLEVAVREGHAASELSLTAGDSVIVSPASS